MKRCGLTLIYDFNHIVQRSVNLGLHFILQYLCELRYSTTVKYIQYTQTLSLQASTWKSSDVSSSVRKLINITEYCFYHFIILALFGSVKGPYYWMFIPIVKVIKVKSYMITYEWSHKAMTSAMYVWVIQHQGKLIEPMSTFIQQ